MVQMILSCLAIAFGTFLISPPGERFFSASLKKLEQRIDGYILKNKRNELAFLDEEFKSKFFRGN